MEENKEEILNLVGKTRYEHILRVKDMALDLAKHYNISVEKAEKAAYYHDCAKSRDYDKLKELSKQYGLKLTYDMQKAPKIIHAFLGALIAEKKYGVNDPEILDAIRYHTTGRENMSLLEKIIFVSDYLEPARKFEGIDEIRKLAYKDIDMALYKCLDRTIVYLIEKEEYLVSETVSARNYIMEKLKWQNSLRHL
ncbi:bis(5'-nucleosyl)-tetraphosphatase (symmetrical) YqeK [Peptoniphilus catoniae]|uniref:bis(5'-nucleosyl)-tetraphosphatase (symmetrical) YqeK n=1 Tax=Peptoniphilus catoniae TaxID=1660341 RepID=UPI001FE4FA22|nr:bis(5'-nucleosyl)-tetraphosphatase (symmetrical) YqeK [Peptoniphilus catoniae]